MLSLADKHDFIAGVVGWIDLASPDCERQLEEYRRHPKFVGMRHVTHDEPDDDFIVREDVLRGLKILEKHRVPFDLLFFVRHLRHAARLCADVPGLPLVLDHLAKPMIKQAIRQLGREFSQGGLLSQRLLQALWHGHRGRLEGMETCRLEAVRGNRPSRLRSQSLYVRLRLASLRAGGFVW